MNYEFNHLFNYKLNNNRKLFFKSQLKVLEDLFPRDWFKTTSSKKAKHPGYKKWELCKKLIQQNGILKWPEDKENLSEIASIVLDNCYFLICSDGNISDIKLGDFINFGDEKVRKRLLCILHDPKQFTSLLTELTYAAWNLSINYIKNIPFNVKVTAYEENGYPDFRIDIIQNLTTSKYPPVIVDCKHINKDTGENIYNKIIKKANKQIKSIKEKSYGLVVIDLTEKVKNTDNFSDNTPKEVIEVSEKIKRCIREFNTSINSVLLFWDDYKLENKPEKSSMSKFYFRRRSILIDHTKPKFNFKNNILKFEYENIIDYKINWS